MKHSIFIRLSLLMGSVTAVILATFLFLNTLISPVIAGGTCNPMSGGSIQAAIDNLSCTTITVGAGTFTETLTIDRSVTINGASSTSTIINANGNSRGITIDGSGIVVYLNNLRVTNGDATTSPAGGNRNGGGIYVTNGATLHGNYLQIDNNNASSSTTGFGGGIAINASSAYISNTLIYYNTANYRAGLFTGAGRGGGLYINNNASLSLANSQILSNTASNRASSGNTASGGGLFVQENTTVTLYNNNWQYNIARGENSSACPLSTCVGGNDTEGGGAIGAGVATPGASAILNIDGDTFTYNIANNVNATTLNSGRGGAIALNTSNTNAQITATIKNVTMNNNIAVRVAYGNGEEGRGGGIFARHTAIDIDKSTILDNESAQTRTNSGNGLGGGLYVREPETDDYTTVTNSVFAGNTASNSINAGAQIHINYVAGPSNEATILNSTLADDTQTQTLALYYNGTSGGDNLVIGNTIFANHINGLYANFATGKARPRYLLFYNVTNDKSAGTGGFPGDDESTWTTGNPLFADAPNGDYHITAGSAAYNTGTNEAGFYTTDDIDGDMRPLFGQYDIGADELNYSIYLPMIIK